MKKLRAIFNEWYILSINQKMNKKRRRKNQLSVCHWENKECKNKMNDYLNCNWNEYSAVFFALNRCRFEFQFNYSVEHKVNAIINLTDDSDKEEGGEKCTPSINNFYFFNFISDLQFPIDLSNVAKDHPFLENDPLQSLYRRLVALNRCATMRLDSAHKHTTNVSNKMYFFV